MISKHTHTHKFLKNVQKSTLERLIFFYYRTENRRHKEKNRELCISTTTIQGVLSRKNAPEHATLTGPVGF